MLAGGVQGIEGVEEFFLGGILAGDKLDIVDEQDVNIAIAIAKFFGLLATNGVDEIVGEFFARDIQHVDIWVP